MSNSHAVPGSPVNSVQRSISAGTTIARLIAHPIANPIRILRDEAARSGVDASESAIAMDSAEDDSVVNGVSLDGSLVTQIFPFGCSWSERRENDISIVVSKECVRHLTIASLGTGNTLFRGNWMAWILATSVQTTLNTGTPGALCTNLFLLLFRKHV